MYVSFDYHNPAKPIFFFFFYDNIQLRIGMTIVNDNDNKEDKLIQLYIESILISR